MYFENDKSTLGDINAKKRESIPLIYFLNKMFNITLSYKLLHEVIRSKLMLKYFNAIQCLPFHFNFPEFIS